MVPRRAILRRSPGVGQRITRCDWALSNRCHAILRVGVVLANAVEVQTCTVVRKAISDVDFDSVAPVRFDRWTYGAKGQVSTVSQILQWLVT